MSDDYPRLTEPQLVELIGQFEARNMKRPGSGRGGVSRAVAEQMGIYPCQVYAHLGQWRKGTYDDLPQPQPAATHSAEAGFKLTADELHRISNLLNELAAVATLLQRRLQQ